MATFLAFVFMFAVLGVIKLIFSIVSAPLRMIDKHMNGNNSQWNIQDDCPHAEYNEFDCWQDNQGR